MRRLIEMLMGITALLIMTVSSSVAAPQGKKIALVITNVAQAYIATLAKSVTDTGKRFGMEVTTFSSPFDAALQAQQMDDAIARKYDMIILVAVSEQSDLSPTGQYRTSGGHSHAHADPTAESGDGEPLFVEYRGGSAIARPHRR